MSEKKSKFSNIPGVVTTPKKGVSKDELIEKVEQEFAVNMTLAKPILTSNLLKFNKHVLGVEKGKGMLPLAPVHEDMCKFIDENKHKKKLSLIPRGHLKSTIITVGRSVQAICEDQTVRILIANATYGLACSFLTEVKRHLKFNEKIKLLWGDLTEGAEKWSENQITLSKAKQEGGKKEPTVTAMGVESNLTSQHYDIIIADDLVNKDYVNTAEQIQKTIDFYKECLNLLEPDGEMIILGTRWDDRDLYGWILDPENKVIDDFEVFHREAYSGDLETGDDFKAIYPQKFTRKHLLKLREQQGPYVFSCNPGEAPILMSDWSVKRIDEITVGDEIMGFERGTPKKRTRLVKTVVKRVESRVEETQIMKMDSGREIRCTPDHKWYTNRFDETHKLYKPALVGSSLFELVNTDKKELTDFQKNEYSYLAGMIDGEGSCKYGSIFIHQSKRVHPQVHQRIKENLTNLEFDFKEEIYGSRGATCFWINGGRQTKFDILRYANPAKREQICRVLDKRSSRWATKDKVVEIIPHKKERVYALETGSGNYFAWGYASSNSQYMNNPIPQDDADFRQDWFKEYDPTDLKGRSLNKFMAIDPAISLEKSADFTAIVTVGVDEFGLIYILDIARVKVPPNELIELIFQKCRIYRPLAVGIEDVAFQKTLQYTLSEEMQKRQEYLPIRPIRPNNRTKDQRIRGLQPLYANGRILHCSQVNNTKHLEDELLRFPRGKHDDVIDALAYLLDFMFPARKNRRSSDRMRKHKYLYR